MGARRRVHPLLWLLIASGLLGAAAWIFQAWLTASVVEVYREKRERVVLWRLSTEFDEAQELVRAGTGQYWRRDVAGLGDFPLIDPSIALADAAGAQRDLDGYLFRSLRTSDEGAPDPARYAVLGFPIRPKGFMYVVTQGRRTWRKRAVAGGVDVFPADPPAEGWEKLPP